MRLNPAACHPRPLEKRLRSSGICVSAQARPCAACVFIVEVAAEGPRREHVQGSPAWRSSTRGSWRRRRPRARLACSAPRLLPGRSPPPPPARQPARNRRSKHRLSGCSNIKHSSACCCTESLVLLLCAQSLWCCCFFAALPTADLRAALLQPSAAVARDAGQS